MQIGIMSDSHDDMAQLKKAVALFNERGVSAVLHAGDLISPFTFEMLDDLNCPITCIFGNNDGDRVLLTDKSKNTITPQPLCLRLGDRKVVMVHEPASVEALASSGLYDVVIYGHTHTPDVRKVNTTLVINPGKTARLHKGSSTVALLETDTLNAQIVSLEP